MWSAPGARRAARRTPPSTARQATSRARFHLTVHAQGKRGLLRREQDQAVGPGGLGHGQGLLLPSLQNGEKSPVQQGVQHLGPDGEAGIRPVEQSAVTGGEGDAVS